MMDTITNIDRVEFGVFSSEEIKKMSVCRVYSNKMVGPNSVYDEMMGVMDNNKLCKSCGKDNKKCPGHFGYISLNYEIIHPLYYKNVMNFLKCFCVKCSRCLVNREQLQLKGIMKYTRESRFNRIVEICEKCICPNIDCQNHQPKFSLNISEPNIYMIYSKKTEKFSTLLTPQEIRGIFDNIPDSDIELLGLNPEKIHPKNLIISELLVLPPVARPYVIADNITCDDDLTWQYFEIVKTNNKLDKSNTKITEKDRTKIINTLKFRIKSLFDNSGEKSKHSNGRPMKGIKKRLSGKEGQIRMNLMGKRVNKSARTVIGPDPTLRLDEIAIPQEIASNLTVPTRVNNINIEYLTELVNNGGANFINRGDAHINLKYAMFRKGTELLYGDVIRHSDNKETIINSQNYKYTLKSTDILLRNGEVVEDVVYPTKKHIRLNIGDIVERKLKEGDVVMLNRQPTLHKGSMLAFTIKIRPGKTIRTNLAVTKTFNADYDGDEMNLHVPSNPDTEAELRNLSHVKHNIMSTQSSRPNITIVQDTLLGVYLMTIPESKRLTREKFYHIANRGDWSMEHILKKIQKIRKIFKLKTGKSKAFHGKGLFSLILPNNFLYEYKNKAHSDEPVVKIYGGVLYEGVINKSICANLIATIHKEYGPDETLVFVNNIQFLANEWLCWNGFSVGIADCIATKTQEINNVINRCFIEAKGVEETTSNPKIREMKVNAALNKARDNGMRIAKEALTQDNSFISTVTSGSKGDFFNIAQITGLLGQQNFSGERIPYTLNENTRSLPHYPIDKKIDKETEYESRGFIKNSFIHGLNPREFWFHAVTGREGVTDTAMKTAQSGYIQRRMVKLGEDVQVKYDGTVRNMKGNIIQFQYGDDGLDGSQTVIMDEKPNILNVQRLVDRLNYDYDNSKRNKK